VGKAAGGIRRAREVYGPLKMTDTGYLPPAKKLSRIAPTEGGQRQTLFAAWFMIQPRGTWVVWPGHAGLFYNGCRSGAVCPECSSTAVLSTANGYSDRRPSRS